MPDALGALIAAGSVPTLFGLTFLTLVGLLVQTARHDRVTRPKDEAPDERARS